MKNFTMLAALSALSAMMLISANALAEESNVKDHDAMVERMGVGYLGASNIQHGEGSLRVPVVGVRYWMDEMMGLDVGLGFHISSGGTKTKYEGADEKSVDEPSEFGFILHGGLPLSFSSGKHHSFQIIPELNFGYGSSKEDKEKNTGMRLDIGARAGAEIHFGFIGIPELSLQGSVGLLFELTNAKHDNDGNPVIKYSHMSLKTTVNDNPWNIFTSNITALYYF